MAFWVWRVLSSKISCFKPPRFYHKRIFIKGRSLGTLDMTHLHHWIHEFSTNLNKLLTKTESLLKINYLFESISFVGILSGRKLFRLCFGYGVWIIIKMTIHKLISFTPNSGYSSSSFQLYLFLPKFIRIIQFSFQLNRCTCKWLISSNSLIGSSAEGFRNCSFSLLL